MKVSIVTVCFNAANQLEKTIKSILEQNYEIVEWVIVDGKSTDNTLKIIDKYKKKIERKKIKMNIKSEKDRGIYDAMNKGIDMANGEWCIFMNAGDCFYSQNSLEYIMSKVKKDYDVIYGDTKQIYINKFKIKIASSEKDLKFFKGMEFCHQSTLIKTKILKEMRYNDAYKIAGDFDFFVRCFKKNYRFKHIDKIISEFQMDGISTIDGARGKFENNEIKFKNKLIGKNEYFINKIRNLLYMKSKKIFPKYIINKRQETIMQNNTKEWEKLK